jgi:hypothetical protein
VPGASLVTECHLPDEACVLHFVNCGLTEFIAKCVTSRLTS